MCPHTHPEADSHTAYGHLALVTCSRGPIYVRTWSYIWNPRTTSLIPSAQRAAPHLLGPHGLGGPRVNQAAITECLPTDPLPVCDSGRNPRHLVPEPRLGRGNSCPHFSLPHDVLLSSSLPLVRLQRQHRWEQARESSMVNESGEPHPRAPPPEPVSLARAPEQGRETGQLCHQQAHTGLLRSLLSAPIGVPTCCRGEQITRTTKDLRILFTLSSMY